MTDASESAWVARAQAGSPDAFGHLVRMHQQGLRAFLRRLSPQEADDIAQDAFVFAWAQIGRFDAQRPFRPWLFGIAWRKVRERRRGILRRLMRESRALEPLDGLAQDDPGLRLDLDRALAALPVEQKAVLLLCLAQDFSHAEAAQVLAIPLGTVKSHIARGRERLQGALGGCDG